MDYVDVMNHTLSALTATQRKEPPPDAYEKVLVEVEIEVPVWITEEGEDAPDVVMADANRWKVTPDRFALQAIQELVEEQVIERLRQDAEARAYDRDDHGDWLYEQRRDREA